MNVWLRVAAVAAASLAAAVLVALFLFTELLHAPPSHTLEALQYLVSSALVALAGGTAALLLLSRYVPSLGAKIGVAYLFGSGAAIVTMLYTPWLMFASHADFYLLIITIVYLVAISLTFAYIIATVTTRQLRTLRDAAMQVASGAFGTRVELQGADEVSDLARAFNRMSAELGEHFEREREMEQTRRDLIASVSHDLRTPLASIRAMVEAINDGVVTDAATTQRYLRLVQQETVHLGQLIDDLFELSRIQSGNLELRFSSVPLPELVAETVDSLRLRAQDKGVRLESSAEPDVPPLPLDGPRIQRVLVNLIENALRHTPAGGSVRVAVDRQNGHVRLQVVDTGEGIDPRDQAHVFDQFFRGERSRSRESGGAGLGLAIARGIVEAHHGSIKVESAPGQGSRFVVTL